MSCASRSRHSRLFRSHERRIVRITHDCVLQDPMRASGGPGSSILGRLHTRGESKMTQPGRPAPRSAALDYDSTIIGALEMSDKKWVLAVQLPGVKRHTRHVLEASGKELASLIERLKARCAPAGQPIARVILTHEAGRDGFLFARFAVLRGRRA